MIKRALLVAAFTAAFITGLTVDAHAGPRSPGCVSHAEWDTVKPVDGRHFAKVAWTRQNVNRHFGTRPFRVEVGGIADDLVGFGFSITSSYRGCWTTEYGQAVVSLDFAKTDAAPFRTHYRLYDGLVF